MGVVCCCLVLCSAILSLACSLVQLLEVVTALGDDVTLARETLLGSSNHKPSLDVCSQAFNITQHRLLQCDTPGADLAGRAMGSSRLSYTMILACVQPDNKLYVLTLGSPGLHLYEKDHAIWYD